jgi:chromosomal replication initiator protein
MDKKELIKSIIEVIADYYDVEVKDLTGKCRRSDVVDARDILVYFLRLELGYTFTEIGDILNRDQSTIVRAFIRSRDKSKDESQKRDNQRIKGRIREFLK